ncbi:MAG TPA: hypothetical protein GXX19_02895 [Syntrophomonadaceae bacterium]|nr:hypothetical protein [Syntrophomonadaceae bacterium]
MNKSPLRWFRIGLAVLLMFITAAGTTYHLVPQLGDAFKLGIFGDYFNFGISVFFITGALLAILLGYPEPARLEKAVGVTLLVAFCTGMLSVIFLNITEPNRGKSRARIVFQEQVASKNSKYSSCPAVSRDFKTRGGLLYFLGSSRNGIKMFCLNLDQGKLEYSLKLEFPPGAEPNYTPGLEQRVLNLKDGFLEVEYPAACGPPERGEYLTVTNEIDLVKRRVVRQDARPLAGETIIPMRYPDITPYKVTTISLGKYSALQVTGRSVDFRFKIDRFAEPSIGYYHKGKIAIVTDTGKAYIIDVSN